MGKTKSGRRLEKQPFFSKSGSVGIIPKGSQQGGPGFIDPDRLNYSFKANSPANALGIKPLDFGMIYTGCRGGG